VNLFQAFIIELVDSICRDGVDMQYLIIQNISQKLKTVNLLAFITNYHASIFKGFCDQQDP